MLKFLSDKKFNTIVTGCADGVDKFAKNIIYI
jgi:hypothetical protein